MSRNKLNIVLEALKTGDQTPIDKVHKEFTVTRSDDGWVTVSTPAVDRMGDRVLPEGIQVDSYRDNPVLLWGHNYGDPFALIGRATDVEVGPSGMRLKPEWREPQGDNDPMTIIRYLWDSDFVRAFSIGFRPLEYQENEVGGVDYTRSEILEVSLVPVPANQEALRAIVRGFGDFVQSREIDDRPAETLGDPAVDELVFDEVDQSPTEARAWVRRLVVETNTGTHSTLACFSPWTREVPQDAVTLDCDDEGELVEVPHPNAGETIRGLDCFYVPPVPYWSQKWGDDEVYATSSQRSTDLELVESDAWTVEYVSDVLLTLDPAVDESEVVRSLGLDVCQITKRGIHAARSLIGRRVGVVDESTVKGSQREELDAPIQDPKTAEFVSTLGTFVIAAVSRLNNKE